MDGSVRKTEPSVDVRGSGSWAYVSGHGDSIELYSKVSYSLNEINVVPKITDTTHFWDRFKLFLSTFKT